MYTKETIDAFIKEIGFKPNMTKAELKELPNVLSPNEKLLRIIEGFLKKIHNRDINGHGIVFVTDKRVVFFRKSFIGTVTIEEIPVSKISSVSFRKGMMYASIAIITSGNEAVVEQCDKDEAKRFTENIQTLISGLGTPAPVAVAPLAAAASSTGHLDQLEKLFDLKQKGILTEDEFTVQKAKLLGI